MCQGTVLCVACCGCTSLSSAFGTPCRWVLPRLSGTVLARARQLIEPVRQRISASLSVNTVSPNVASLTQTDSSFQRHRHHGPVDTSCLESVFRLRGSRDDFWVSDVAVSARARVLAPYILYVFHFRCVIRYCGLCSCLLVSPDPGHSAGFVFLLPPNPTPLLVFSCNPLRLPRGRRPRR